MLYSSTHVGAPVCDARQADGPDRPYAAPDLPPGDLREAELPVGEDDRHLRQPEAEPVGAVLQVDQERVATEAERRHVDRLEHLAADALKAAGAVAHRQASHAPGIGVRPQAHREAIEAPVDDADAAHVARADDEVGGLRAG